MVAGDSDYGISVKGMMGRSIFARPLVIVLFLFIESLRNRTLTADRRERPNVYE